jgi:hypothetical protein
MTKEPEEKKDTRNAHQRLAAAMMEAGYVQKEEKQVNNQYRFVSHDGVVREIRPALLKNGLVVESKILEHKLELQEMTETIMVWSKEANAKIPLLDKEGKTVLKTTMGYCCTILAEFYIVNQDNPTDRITAQGLGQGIDSQDKAVGKAMSYAKKNAFIWAMLLEGGDDPEKDVDYTVGKKEPLKQEPKKTAGAKKASGEGILAAMNACASSEALNDVWFDYKGIIEEFKNSPNPAEKLFHEQIMQRGKELREGFKTIDSDSIPY